MCFFTALENLKIKSGMVVVYSLRRQRWGKFSEFEARLIYQAISRRAIAIQTNPVSYKKKNNKQKETITKTEAGIKTGFFL